MASSEVGTCTRRHPLQVESPPRSPATSPVTPPPEARPRRSSRVRPRSASALEQRPRRRPEVLRALSGGEGEPGRDLVAGGGEREASTLVGVEGPDVRVGPWTTSVTSRRPPRSRAMATGVGRARDPARRRTPSRPRRRGRSRARARSPEDGSLLGRDATLGLLLGLVARPARSDSHAARRRARRCASLVLRQQAPMIGPELVGSRKSALSRKSSRPHGRVQAGDAREVAVAAGGETLVRPGPSGLLT